MHQSYDDIRARIVDPPLWFDEHGVPRYVPFHPRSCADIYAREAALIEVACQSCGTRFVVACSWSVRLVSRIAPIADRIRAGALEYGDPPNVRCCPAGPSMASVPKRALEYWRRDTSDGAERYQWQRDDTLEGELRCRWWGDEAEREAELLRDLNLDDAD